MTLPAEVPAREEQLRVLVDKISAYVEQFHGGSVTFLRYDGRTLAVRLGGACIGCPLLPSTLHGWVAGTIHQFFPDVEVVTEDGPTPEKSNHPLLGGGSFLDSMEQVSGG